MPLPWPAPVASRSLPAGPRARGARPAVEAELASRGRGGAGRARSPPPARPAPRPRPIHEARRARLWPAAPEAAAPPPARPLLTAARPGRATVRRVIAARGAAGKRAGDSTGGSRGLLPRSRPRLAWAT